MSPAEEVKSKLNIIEIIQEYVPLKKRGASYFANCPFHQEKTPSFHVSAERQFYKCFGCGEGGDAFAFVQKMEGMEFPEALRHLAEKAGVKIERFDPKVLSGRNRVLDLLDLSARYYHEVLLRSTQGEEARQYLKTRGLLPITVELFALGHAPDSWDSLLNFLISKKYTAKEVYEAGLAVARERGDGYYDRFRGRIMFPIKDLHGRVVGFTARILPSQEAKEQAGGKYINTPQTDFYNKSRVLYGLDLAKREIKNQNLAILVEGNMDVISCHQAGMKNVIASSGTALTEEQVALIKRFTDNIALSFDMDTAGALAAEKGIGLLLSAGMNIKVITLPEGAGKDPDEAIKKNLETWRSAVTEAKPVMPYLFSSAERKFGKRGGEDRKNFGKMLLPFIAKISDQIEQNFWIQELGRTIETSESVLRQYIKPSQGVSKGVNKSALAQVSSRHMLLGRRLLSIMLILPGNTSFVIDQLTPLMLRDELESRLYEEMIVFYNNNGNISYADLKQKLAANQENAGLLDVLDRVILTAETDFGEMDSEVLQKELLNTIKDIRTLHLNEETKLLTRELAKAEGGGDKARTSELFIKIQELHKKGGEHHS